MHTSPAIRKLSVGRNKNSRLYFQENQDNALVVIFPDVNYSPDRPLLYYARKAALLEGHDVLCLSYKRRLTWRDTSLYTIDLEADSSTETIRKCLRKDYKNLYFISKGIGSEVGGVVSSRLGYEKIGSIFLAPTNHAVKHIVNSRCVVVIGSKDEIFKQEHIGQIQECKNVELILVKDADRRLEVPDDMNKTLEALGQMVSLYSRFFKK